MKPIVLCIMDGVGINNNIKGNAVKQAKMPNYNYLLNHYPHSLLEASGTSVGLPAGQMGNSEVGHTNIGAGRVVYQPLELINKKIDDGTFTQNEEIIKVIKHIQNNNSNLHLCGLISDGGVHSHIDHLLALLGLCSKEVSHIYLHLFTDGRDTLNNSALQYLDVIDKKCQELGNVEIATISGRYYSMDRDNRWDRTQKSYLAMCDNIGNHYQTYQDVINDSYQKEVTDEFIEPAIICQEGMIKDNDGVFVFNFRPDRLRQLWSVFTNPNFNQFPHHEFHNLYVATMMYVSDEVIAPYAFSLEKIDNSLGYYISKLGKKQLRIAETEKYAHVTYFFDGGRDIPLAGEERILIPSPKVATYDLKPEMSAKEITASLLKELDKDYDIVILNYANGDMLGHTGNLQAAILGLEVVDECLGQLYSKVKDLDGVLIVTADHGNCEEMLDQNNHVLTSHTTNLVPFIICKDNLTIKNGKLADIAPTILSLMGLNIPSEMTGDILIK